VRRSRADDGAYQRTCCLWDANSMRSVRSHVIASRCRSAWTAPHRSDTIDIGVKPHGRAR
jgi:hypothetical protein